MRRVLICIGLILCLVSCSKPNATNVESRYIDAVQAVEQFDYYTYVVQAPIMSKTNIKTDWLRIVTVYGSKDQTEYRVEYFCYIEYPDVVELELIKREVY